MLWYLIENSWNENTLITMDSMIFVSNLGEAPNGFSMICFVKGYILWFLCINMYLITQKNVMFGAGLSAPCSISDMHPRHKGPGPGGPSKAQIRKYSINLMK